MHCRCRSDHSLVQYGRLVILASTIALVVAPTAAARPQVAGLQVALHAHGLYSGPVDGIYGPATARGLRRLQRGAGLTVDGRIGPATRTALGRLGRPAFGARLLRRRAAGWDVSVLQYRLVQAGARLQIDGHFGVRTERALKGFQRAHRLHADGVAGRQTLRALLLRRAPLNFVGIGPSRVRGLIDYWATHYGVDKPLMRALAWMESGFHTDVRSPAGAWGVMQILPTTWNYVELVLIGRPVRRTASGNVRVGVAYMRELLREFKGHIGLAVAAWYQGPASVRRVGPFPVTRLFVADVLSLRQRFT
jgi:transglycosylase-like protein with SLT domain/putative peptidoglycan binding protein